MGKILPKKWTMRYTKNKLVQIQLVVNLIRFLEGFSSWGEEEYSQLDQEHKKLYNRFSDHVEQLR